MAKKSKKSAKSKATAKTKGPAKKAAKKALKKAPAKKAKSAAKGPRSISTGSGANVAEIGSQFVAMFNAATPDAKIWESLFAKNWTSIEGFGVGMAFEGRKAVEAKCKEWVDTHEIHGASCEGPFLGATGFAVEFKMDVTDKTTNQRMNMREVAVYTVKNGKIIQEEFMYGGC